MFQPAWGTYGGNSQHTGITKFATSPLEQVLWSTDIDPTNPVSQGGDLFVHYGSPLITRFNTVIVPVTTQSGVSYSFYAFKGADGSEVWHFDSDYVPGPSDWTPPVEGTIVLGISYAMPGIGGSVYIRNRADMPTSGQTKFFFYGKAAHDANQAWADANIKITTPLMSDNSGNMWFGYYVGGDDPSVAPTYPAGFPDLGRGGLARVTMSSVRGPQAKWITAPVAASDTNVNFCAVAATPALSPDGKSVYACFINQYNDSRGYLVKLDAQTLVPQAKVQPLSPNSGNPAGFIIDSSACPMVGPDGDVYMGVFGLGGDYRESHGWMEHYDSNLNPKGATGAFGWDDTASVVPASAVPQYQGTSTYLILTKYNNYGEWYPGDPGSDGLNQVAILDPNDPSGVDRQTGVPVMKPIIAVYGITPDPTVPAPNGVREWCINSAAIDPASKCAIINSEDGHLYRWDFTTNSLGPVNGPNTGVALNAPTGEAYTPTVVGPNGTSYAINAHRLYAVGPIN